MIAPPRPPAAPPGEPEALIREARRRARRRRGAVAAVIVLAVGAGAAGLFLWRAGGGPPVVAAPSPAELAAAAKRIAAVARSAPIVAAGRTGGVGWAMDGYGLWLTADGGASWLTATPPHVRTTGDAVARIGQIEFVDRAHGWLSASDVVGGFELPPQAPTWRHMEIDRTTDGGRTWHAAVPPGCLQTCGGVELSFLDARRGFAIAAQGFFATRDGGAAWTRVSRPPFSGPIAFLDARRGFGVSDPSRWGGPQYAVPFGGGIPYRTTDGGRTWTRVALAAPAAYAGWERTVGVAAFFGSQGVLPVRFREPRTHVQRLVVYTSADGGATWTGRPAPADVRWSHSLFTWGLPSAQLFSAATRRVWVVNGERVLFATRDAGRSWRTVRPLDLPARATFWAAEFASAADGWAIVWLPHGNTGSGVLVRTTDGGRTWTPLAPPVPKPPPPPKTTTACGSSCARP